MSSNRILLITSVIAATAFAGLFPSFAADEKQPKKQRTSPLGYEDTPVLPGQTWRVHDLKRPHPKIIDPGTPSTYERPGKPPSDAVVLFDGTDLSKWNVGNARDPEERKDLGKPAWVIENGAIRCAFPGGGLTSKQKFGDGQYHIEWASPKEIDGSGQWRGNSGVLLMNRYEIQVLDSIGNPTYADGQAGAIYGQYPPLVNASRKAGEWQIYDIVFEAPKFEGEKLVKPGYVTVFHNGVLLHHRKEIVGRMAHRVVGTYAPHGPEEPFGLQNHDTRVMYRNIWIRPLGQYDQPEGSK